MIEIPINKISNNNYTDLGFMKNDILKKYAIEIKDLKIKSEDNIINILSKCYKELKNADIFINRQVPK